MTTYVITRQHTKPDNEEHAAMCYLREQVIGDGVDMVEAKLRMLRMVLANESGDRKVFFLVGLTMLGNEHRDFVSWTTQDCLQYRIRRA